MIKEKAEAIRKAMLFLDILVVALSFLLAFLIRQKIPEAFQLGFLPRWEFMKDPSASLNDYLVLLFLSAPIWCVSLYWNGIYRNLRTRRLFEVVLVISKSALFALVGFGTLIFLLKMESISRLFIVIFIGLSFLFIMIEKIMIVLIMRYLRRKGRDVHRILMVGKGKRAIHMIRKIKDHPEWGLQILGAIDDEPGKGPTRFAGVPFMGYLNDLEMILKNEAIDEVMFILPRSRLNFIEKAVQVCETVGIKATVAMDLFDLKLAKCRNRELGGVPFVSFETTVANEAQLLFKRIMDILISGVGIVVGLPIFIIIGVLIKVSSRGPVLFKQTRAGLNGREFVLFKFRTMYEGADLERADMAKLNEMEGPVFKIKRDPRINGVGRVLRKFSLDELPQLFNVIAGHMSLIGPRAMATYEVEKIKPWQRRRLSMRPGLTGLWQISGRSTVDFDRWMELDLQYLDNWSIGLDIKILIKTIPVVFFGIGAY
jgi:exopolysaccharide biosynthesis polyprenyl glycosylphosphotransferase